MQTVYIIQGFNDEIGIPAAVIEKAKSGEIELYNAARPFPCHQLYQGEFRRGIFWGEIDPAREYADGYRERAVSLDAYYVQFVTQEQIRTDMQLYYSENYPEHSINVYDYTLDDILYPWLKEREKIDNER